MEKTKKKYNAKRMKSQPFNGLSDFLDRTVCVILPVRENTPIANATT